MPLPAPVTSLLFVNSSLFTALSMHTSNLKHCAAADDTFGHEATVAIGSEEISKEDGAKEESRIPDLTDLNEEKSSQEIPCIEKSNTCNSLEPNLTEREKKETGSNILESNSTKSVEDNNVVSYDDSSIDSMNISEDLKQPSTVSPSVPSADDPLSCAELRALLPHTHALSQENSAALAALEQQLSDAFAAAGPEWAGAAQQMWSVGPGHCGPNVLLNRVQQYSSRPSVWQPAAPLPDSALAAMDHGIVTGQRHQWSMSEVNYFFAGNVMLSEVLLTFQYNFYRRFDRPALL